MLGVQRGKLGQGLVERALCQVEIAKKAISSRIIPHGAFSVAKALLGSILLSFEEVKLRKRRAGYWSLGIKRDRRLKLLLGIRPALLTFVELGKRKGGRDILGIKFQSLLEVLLGTREVFRVLLDDSDVQVGGRARWSHLNCLLCFAKRLCRVALHCIDVGEDHLGCRVVRIVLQDDLGAVSSVGKLVSGQ